MPDFYQALTIGLAWDPPSDAGAESILAYEIELSDDPYFANNAQYSVSPRLMAVIPAPTKGMRYYCRVRAVTPAGPGPFSAVYGPVTSNSTPGAPTIVSTAAGEANGTLFLSVAWSAPADTGDLTDAAIGVLFYELDLSGSPRFDGPTVSLSKAPSPREPVTEFHSMVDGADDPAVRRLLESYRGEAVFCRVRATTEYGTGESSAVADQRLEALPPPVGMCGPGTYSESAGGQEAHPERAPGPARPPGPSSLELR